MIRIQQFAAAWALCLAAAPIALAQSAASAPAKTPARPPAKSQATAPSIVLPAAPAVKTAPKTLAGKGAPVGKMLTREELRTCLKRLDGINVATKDLEQRRVALDREKDEHLKSGEALKTVRADVDVKLAAVRDWEVRMRAHGAEIETFNKRLKAAEEAPRSQREELAKDLEAERERLNKARVPLSEDEARLVPVYQNAVKAYNERALARDGVVNEWNTRNKALNDKGIDHDGERSTWLTECANRPYREDDEIAIKAGK